MSSKSIISNNLVKVDQIFYPSNLIENLNILEYEFSTHIIDTALRNYLQ